MKIFVAFTFYIVAFMSCYGQVDKATIYGRLLVSDSHIPIQEAQILLPKWKQMVSTDSNGNFEINSIPFGNVLMQVMINNELIDSFSVSVTQEIIKLGDVFITIHNNIMEAQQTESVIPTIMMDSDPNVLQDEGISEQQNISIVLNAAGKRDPFLSALSFVMGQYNFRPRGYNKPSQQVLINGILMNDAVSENAIWSQWGGLNEVTKNEAISYGLSSHQQSVGTVNGVVAFDINSSEKLKQNKLSYSIANRNYNNRVMYTYHSGLSKAGWAVTFSAVRRWANEAYVPGTFMDNYSSLISISKVITPKQQLNVNIIAAKNLNGRGASATQEMYSLASDNYYNPNWGWQSGLKRNARIVKRFQPIAILQHQYRPNEKTQINSSVAYQMGQSSTSSLDWYNAIDPRPDYYRNLPSNYVASNPLIAQEITNELKAHPEKMQINWERLYDANRNNVEILRNVNGNSYDSLKANRSIYVLGADVEQLNKMNIATNFVHKHSEKIIFSGGVQIMLQQSEFYRRLEDLLGGDYFLNYNMFAAQQFVGDNNYLQNDLNTPNRAVLKGDKYRYNYKANIQKYWAWGQLDYNVRKINIAFSFSSGITNYSRNGMYRNGLFAQNSFGKSTAQQFFNYTLKGGVTYKINGRNYLLGNAFHASNDQGFNHIFIAPQLRNQNVQNVEMQQTQSVEAGYLLRGTKWNLRTMGYATDIKNATTIQRFYNDAPEFQSFVNFVISKINTRHIGLECAVEYTINSSLSVNAVASIGQSFYTNRPNVAVYSDNDTTTTPVSKEVFIKNYYLGVGPQSAYTLGLAYNNKHYWFLKLNANFFDRNFISVNPSRRTTEAAEFVSSSDSLYHKIYDQEKLPSFFTIDLSGGKSFRLHKIIPKVGYSTMVYLNFGMSNLLNNRNIISSGFEQLRYDFTNNNPDKFPNKYVFGLGRTFFVNLSFKF